MNKQMKTVKTTTKPPSYTKIKGVSVKPAKKVVTKPVVKEVDQLKMLEEKWKATNKSLASEKNKAKQDSLKVIRTGYENRMIPLKKKLGKK